ncbi:MAG: histone deacetylase family protein [Arenimonas sp.]
MRIYTHPDCLEHDPGSGHPECPARLHSVIQAIHGALPLLEWQHAPHAERYFLERAHSRELIEKILDTEIHESFHIDADTVMSPASKSAALHASGAGVAAANAIMRGEIKQAFCAVRPPGHHATRNTAMGFCLFNNIAVCAKHLLTEHRLQRIAIVDFDVHHGNGTEDIFKDDPRVFYLSTHEAGIYPNTGFAESNQPERLSNALLMPGSGSEDFRAIWQQKFLPELVAYRPDIILISAGFDAHRLDPLADLNLQADDYFWLSQELAAIAKQFSEGRIISMLEGGYSLTALRECSVAHLRGLMA